MCGGPSAVSRLGVLCGIAALGTLLTAFVGGAWLYTREPVTLPNSEVNTVLSFRIGLWRICPSVKRPPNYTIHMPSPACSLVKYSGWEEIVHSDLGVWMPLEFTPSFISQMRISTVFEGVSVCLLLLATVFALMGHCNGDHKTLIACGLYILGGLSLGSGLVVFATVLSETYVEATSGKRSFIPVLTSGGASSSSISSSPGQLPMQLIYDYRYGWSFFTAIVAFVLAEMAALFSISGYLRRFPTVEDMVREMVPGAERKLREHQRLSSEYLVRHSGPLPLPMPLAPGGKYHHHQHHYQHQHQHQYDPITTAAVSTVHNRTRPSKSDLHLSELEACDGGPLLSKTPPDVCTGIGTNADKVDSLHVTSSVIIPGLISDQDLTAPTLGQSLAGQTVPITIKNHGISKFSYGHNQSGNKYGTLPHHFGSGSTASYQHQGYLGGVSGVSGVSEIASGGPSSTSTTTTTPASSLQQHRSMTLQHPRTTGKKSVTIGTFQTMDTATSNEALKRAAVMHAYQGSAV